MNADAVARNAIALIAGSWTTYVNADGDETGYYAFSKEQAVNLALEVETEVNVRVDAHLRSRVTSSKGFDV